MPFDTTRLAACGQDVRIHESVVFRYPELVRIGSRVAIDPYCVFTTRLTIGSHVHIGPHVSAIGGRESHLDIRDHVNVTAGCRLIVASDDFTDGGEIGAMAPPEADHARILGGELILERHVALGTNTVVLPASRFGVGAVTGSLTLVRGTLEPWTVYVGQPSRALKPRPRDRIDGTIGGT